MGGTLLGIPLDKPLDMAPGRPVVFLSVSFFFRLWIRHLLAAEPSREVHSSALGFLWLGAAGQLRSQHLMCAPCAGEVVGCELLSMQATAAASGGATGGTPNMRGPALCVRHNHTPDTRSQPTALQPITSNSARL